MWQVPGDACEWCSGVPDGYHGDPQAVPPCRYRTAVWYGTGALQHCTAPVYWSAALQCTTALVKYGALQHCRSPVECSTMTTMRSIAGALEGSHRQCSTALQCSAAVLCSTIAAVKNSMSTGTESSTPPFSALCILGIAAPISCARAGSWQDWSPVPGACASTLSLAAAWCARRMAAPRGAGGGASRAGWHCKQDRLEVSMGGWQDGRQCGAP